MLCMPQNAGDVTGLAQCLLSAWDFNYAFYYYLHYALGTAGVLLPVLSTILSDVDNKNIRRAITGLSAVSVSLYAFLAPMDKVATYKSAHTELRETMMLYERYQQTHPAKDKDAEKDAEEVTLYVMDHIAELEAQVLNSEKAAAKKDGGDGGKDKLTGKPEEK